MNSRVKKPESQVMYLGRWVNKDNFRVFVYNEKSKKLVNSYEEYEELISSTLWFSEKPIISTKKSKKTPSIESVEEQNHGSDG
jgi:hypothetical protein